MWCWCVACPSPKKKRVRGGSRRGGPRVARTPVGFERRGARALDHVQAAGAADGRQRRHGAQVEVAQRRLPARWLPAQAEPGRRGRVTLRALLRFWRLLGLG